MPKLFALRLPGEGTEKQLENELHAALERGVKWEAAEAADDAALAWEERRGAPFAVRLSPLPISTWLRVTGAATADRLRAVIGGTNATALARNAIRSTRRRLMT